MSDYKRAIEALQAAYSGTLEAGAREAEKAIEREGLVRKEAYGLAAGQIALALGDGHFGGIAVDAEVEAELRRLHDALLSEWYAISWPANGVVPAVLFGSPEDQ